jgi:hypothetical protein
MHFLDNTTQSASAQQIYLYNGTSYLTNTVVYGASSATMLYKNASATLNASYSLVKGMTLSGSGNLSGMTDPLLRFDGRLHYNSPLIEAGVNVLQSKLDLDLSPMPGSWSPPAT